MMAEPSDFRHVHENLPRLRRAVTHGRGERGDEGRLKAQFLSFLTFMLST